ncbi:MAG: endonuclease, partial [Frankiales bacterium]|nr:endonuclease [Frankiales bacterium]
DDLSGELLDYGLRTYRPPQHLQNFVIARAQRCIIRGCSRPARLCDVDHRVPFDQGGPTSAANLDPLCERHHIMKHTGGWQLLRESSGALCWVSAAGVRYPVRREAIDPSHDEREEAPNVEYTEPPAALLERATAHSNVWTAARVKAAQDRDLEPPF